MKIADIAQRHWVVTIAFYGLVGVILTLVVSHGLVFPTGPGSNWPVHVFWIVYSGCGLLLPRCGRVLGTVLIFISLNLLLQELHVRKYHGLHTIPTELAPGEYEKR